MTSTTKSANGNRSESKPKNATPIGDGWDDVPRASGGSEDTPEWCPQFTELKEARALEMLEQKPEGSHMKEVVIGKPIIATAFGEPRYFLETADVPGGRLALPTHGILTTSLDKYAVDTIAVMRIAIDGRAARARPNQQAAFTYDIRAKDANGKPVHQLLTPREDALHPIHKENKAKREAAEADAAKPGKSK